MHCGSLALVGRGYQPVRPSTTRRDAPDVRVSLPRASATQSSSAPLLPIVDASPPNPQLFHPSSTAPSQPSTQQQDTQSTDAFAWLHDPSRRDPRVLRYLQQENEYCKLQLRHLGPLRQKLEQELAEAAWQQALMLAAQTPYTSPSSPSALSSQQRHQAAVMEVAADGAVYGGRYAYRREPSGVSGRFRHLRVQLTTMTCDALPPPHSAAGVLLVDEQQRCCTASAAASAAAAANSFSTAPSASASASVSAAYSLHSFAPSPTFDVVAFTEATQPVPQGQLRPDRFSLHLMDAATGAPLLLPPLPLPALAQQLQSSGRASLMQLAPSGVSGDLGWVVLPANGPEAGGQVRSSSSSSSGSKVGSSTNGGVGRDSWGRLYFTRGAQRELWCMDVAARYYDGDGAKHPSTTGDGVSCAAVPAVLVASLPRLAFRDPDGQPIRLARYGRHLYCESLGNNGVPLEIRLLGLETVGGDAAEGGGDGTGTVASMSRPGQASSGQQDTDEEYAGRPLLPRVPGRTYSALPLQLYPQHRQGPTWQGVGSSGNGGGSSADALVLWLRDLDCPNGCLLLALAGAADGLAQRQQSALQAAPLPLQKLLLAHPALRIVHVEVHPNPATAAAAAAAAAVAAAADGAGAAPPAGLLVVREEVDPERGGPTGRYLLQELEVVALEDRVGVETEASRGQQQQATAAAAGAVEGLNGGAPAVVAVAAVAVRRSRWVALVGGARHGSLQVLGWDGAAEVGVSYSSMASPPATAAVMLLPCGSGVDGVAVTVAVVTAAEMGAEATKEMMGAPADRVGAASTSSRGAGEGRDQGAEAVAAMAPPAPAGSAGPARDILELRCEDDGGGIKRAADPWILVTEQLWATSHDGLEVPITLCRRRARVCKRSAGAGAEGDESDTPAPLLLRVYGAYGMDPPLEYQAALQPLLRRGVAVAVAHVRGGSRLGPAWYEGGRGRNKSNSWKDLVAAARRLVGCGVTAPKLLCLEAESAGGWAAGPALRYAGELFHAALLTVPTLDPLNGLLDDPTYGPYELGGDPWVDPELAHSVAAWSPYEGLRQQQQQQPAVRQLAATYPALLLRIGLFDTNVPYWDPAKYMATHRSATATAGMAAATAEGCGGRNAPARLMQVRPGGHEAFDTIPDDALRCAFVLWAVGAWLPPPPATAAPRPAVARGAGTAESHASPARRSANRSAPRQNSGPRA